MSETTAKAKKIGMRLINGMAVHVDCDDYKFTSDGWIVFFDKENGDGVIEIVVDELKEKTRYNRDHVLAMQDITGMELDPSPKIHQANVGDIPPNSRMNGGF